MRIEKQEDKYVLYDGLYIVDRYDTEDEAIKQREQYERDNEITDAINEAIQDLKIKLNQEYGLSYLEASIKIRAEMI